MMENRNSTGHGACERHAGLHSLREDCTGWEYQCPEYPPGRVNEDGTDEPQCGRCMRLPNGYTAHLMDHGLAWLHDDRNRYVESYDTIKRAFGAAEELVRGHG